MDSEEVIGLLLFSSFGVFAIFIVYGLVAPIKRPVLYRPVAQPSPQQERFRESTGTPASLRLWLSLMRVENHRMPPQRASSWN